MSGTWASNWVNGDVVTAAEFKKGMGAIYDTTLGAPAASIDLTGIVATYAHLLIVAQLRCDHATVVASAGIRFNNDATAIYDWERIYGTAATPTSAETFADTSGQIGNIPGSSVAAGIAGSLSIFIPNYAGTTFNKAYTSTVNHKGGVSSGNMFSGVWGGQWRSSVAINRVTLVQTGSNFIAGSRVTVYAMGA